VRRVAPNKSNSSIESPFSMYARSKSENLERRTNVFQGTGTWAGLNGYLPQKNRGSCSLPEDSFELTDPFQCRPIANSVPISGYPLLKVRKACVRNPLAGSGLCPRTTILRLVIHELQALVQLSRQRPRTGARIQKHECVECHEFRPVTNACDNIAVPE